MISPRTCVILILAATIGAAALRLPRLTHRPMHTDEAVHAVKFGELLEQGIYVYDPVEFHGPTLNYFTLIPACLLRQHTIAQVNEFTLRVVPAVFGVMLIPLLLIVRKELGYLPAAIAALLIAASPALTFYSRYYIQETLLVCFTIGFIILGFKFLQTGRIVFAAGAGVFAGLAHATKETFLVVILCSIGTILLMSFFGRFGNGKSKLPVTLPSVLVLLVCAAVTSALFYSSFLSNPAGVLDSIKAYGTYFDRAKENAFHIHPWYYYFAVMLSPKCGRLPDISSLVLMALSVCGGIVAFADRTPANKRMWQFVALYTLLTIIVYCSIPYKTPWCLINFLPGMLLLAALAFSRLFGLLEKKLYRRILCTAICILAAQQAWQAVSLNFKYYADPCNPYIYAQTTTDIPELSRAVVNTISALPDNDRTQVEVICPGDDYWPLPWYLRTLGRVGWHSKVDPNAARADIIIVYASLEPALSKRLYETAPAGERHLYVLLTDKPIYLRPGVELNAYIRQDLLEHIRQK